MGYAYFGYTIGGFVLILIAFSPFVIRMINKRTKKKDVIQ